MGYDCNRVGSLSRALGIKQEGVWDASHVTDLCTLPVAPPLVTLNQAEQLCTDSCSLCRGGDICVPCQHWAHRAKINKNRFYRGTYVAILQHIRLQRIALPVRVRVDTRERVWSSCSTMLPSTAPKVFSFILNQNQI